MVGFVRADLAAAIELFEKQKPRDAVRKGHFGK
jgi:hypothetical protein